MKVITFITENYIQVDFEKVELEKADYELYKVAIEYEGEYEEIFLLLLFEEVMEVMKKINDFDVSELTVDKIRAIL